MVGSIVLTLRDREGVKRQSIPDQLSRSSQIELKDVKSREGVDI